MCTIANVDAACSCSTVMMVCGKYRYLIFMGCAVLYGIDLHGSMGLGGGYKMLCEYFLIPTRNIFLAFDFRHLKQSTINDGTG